MFCDWIKYFYLLFGSFNLKRLLLIWFYPFSLEICSVAICECQNDVIATTNVSIYGLSCDSIASYGTRQKNYKLNWKKKFVLKFKL